MRVMLVTRFCRQTLQAMLDPCKVMPSHVIHLEGHHGFATER